MRKRGRKRSYGRERERERCSRKKEIMKNARMDDKVDGMRKRKEGKGRNEGRK